MLFAKQPRAQKARSVSTDVGLIAYRVLHTTFFGCLSFLAGLVSMRFLSSPHESWHHSLLCSSFVLCNEDIQLLRSDSLPISAPSKVRSCANAQYYQTVCAVKSHSRGLAAFQMWYREYIYYISRITFSTLETFTSCLSVYIVSCALKQAFSQCKVFLEGTLLPMIVNSW